MSTILQTIDLRKSYKVGKIENPVLHGVSLAIEKGEFVAIMGPSGCGKSTLLHLLGGLLSPTLTAEGNLKLAEKIHTGNGGGSATNRREVLRLLKLEDKMHHKPLELSGGEQQRVALARAVVNNPAIILADEPTGNLDTENSEIVLEMFKELNQRFKQTIIMITHNPEAAENCHRIIQMLDGRI